MKFDVCMPILGFEDIKEVELEKIDDVFMKMQSVGDENISFTLINPFTLREYSMDIPKNTQEVLGITKDSNVLVFNIVLIQKPIEDSIVNFVSPLIFNEDTKKVTQIILQNPSYGITEKISDYLQKE